LLRTFIEVIVSEVVRSPWCHISLIEYRHNILF